MAQNGTRGGPAIGLLSGRVRKIDAVFSFLRIVSALVGFSAFCMIIPAAVALYEKEYDGVFAFLAPMALFLIPAVIILFATRNTPFALSPQSGFAAVAACWIVTGIAGSLPIVFSGEASLPDAIFESVSGFTTTGASVLTDVSSLPVYVNLWRCLTHWIGGIGIVVLTAALLPLIGGNGFWLYKAETSGPEKGRITPKIAQTAKILWLVYFGLTAVETVCLLAAGMNFPDALSHAFSTMGTGGFSTKTEGIGFWNSRPVEIVIAVFMFLAGINFSLYFSLFTRRFDEITGNSELRAYCLILVVTTAIISVVLVAARKTLWGILPAVFHVLSILTTTGFSTEDFTLWAFSAQILLFFLMFTGGCAGSTSGGVKIIRWVIMAKQTAREYRRTLHPHGVFTMTLNGKPVKSSLIFSAAAFIALYFAVVFATALAAAAIDKSDMLTSLTASLCVTGNIGVAFGATGPAGSFAFFSYPVKLIFSLAMLAGRLELYAVLLLFFPKSAVSPSSGT
ncbi:MAG: potassium transporter TrkG [Treponemataceae bacterium]|nr:MAG: potassium transporter TrkG [Treponemataceae bacterium]